MIASYSAGELAYHSRRRFIDLFGLGDSNFSRRRMLQRDYDAYVDYLPRLKPDLFIVEGASELLMSFFQREGYRLRKVILVDREPIPPRYQWPEKGDRHLLVLDRGDGHATEKPGEDDVEILLRQHRLRVARRDIVYFEELRGRGGSLPAHR
jgi:hypothetical protein